MTLTLSLNWWQMCLLILGVGIPLGAFIGSRSQSTYDMITPLFGLAVWVISVVLCLGIIVGKFVFGGG